MKIVENITDLREVGTDEHFFLGDDYLKLSDGMADTVRRWCQSNLTTVQLRSKHAIHDEPLEPFLVTLGDAKGKTDLNNLMKALGGELVDILSRNAAIIDGKNVMDSKASEAFDNIEEVARLRTLLLKAKGRYRRGSFAALVIEV